MATPYKTGAYVYFAEYNAYAAADLYQVCDALIVRHNGREHWTFNRPARKPTHECYIGHGFDKDGVIVVPEDGDQLRGMLREVKS